MTPRATLIAIAAVIMVFAWIMYVIFGQVTVRKLRKNPAAKEHLGANLMSGWDIFNVAQALTIPKSWADRIAKGRLSYLEANTEILYQHTTKFDRILAKVFYLPFIGGGVLLLITMVLDLLGLLE